jgi:hypothetical protein
LKGLFLRLTWLFLVIISGPAPAQWVATSGPVNQDVTVLAVNGTNIFAGTSANGIFISPSDGNSWTAANTGLTNLHISSFAFYGSGSIVFTGTNNGLFGSSTGGFSWMPANNGLTSHAITTLAGIGSNIFAGTWDNGMFISSDLANNWSAINNGLTNHYITTSASTGPNLFAGTYGGLFLSGNNGGNWSAVNNSLPHHEITALATSGSAVFAAVADSGVYYSPNNGSNWIQVNNGLTCLSVNSLVLVDNYIFAGTSTGVFVSANNGSNWTNASNGLGGLSVWSLAVKSAYLFAGTGGAGVWKRSLSDILGTRDNEGDRTITLYPNPSQNYICFTDDVNNIKILNAQGQLMYSSVKSHTLNIENLSDGIYFISFDYKNKKIVKQLVKQ